VTNCPALLCGTVLGVVLFGGVIRNQLYDVSGVAYMPLAVGALILLIATDWSSASY